MKSEEKPPLSGSGTPKRRAKVDPSRGILSSGTTSIAIPTEGTLKRYGLKLIEWIEIAVGQDCACFVCKRVPKSGRLCIDHEHVKGWKDMEPNDRKKYVRGLLCWTCNHYYLSRGMTVERALNTAEYLRRYESKKRDSTSGV